MKKYLLLIVAIFLWGCEKALPDSTPPKITSVSIYSTGDGDKYIEWERDYDTGDFLAEADKESSATIEIRGVNLASDKYTTGAEVEVVGAGDCYTYSLRTDNTIICSVGGWRFKGAGKYFVKVRTNGEDGEWTAINEDHYIMVY